MENKTKEEILESGVSVINEIVVEDGNVIDEEEVADMDQLNRELSWLDFNFRVLDQVRRLELPLKERFKFLSIASSNLDEFTMVRFPTTYEYDTDEKLSREVYKKLLLNRKTQDVSFTEIISESKEQNIHFVMDFNELSKKELKHVDKLFDNHIYPFLSPIAYDSSRQFPLISSRELAMIIVLEDERFDVKVLNVISLDNVDRFYDISDDPSIQKIVTVEEIIKRNLSTIFINKRVVSSGLIKILRNSNTEVSHVENIYIVDRMRKVVYDRERSDVEYIEVSNTFDKETNKSIRGIFGVKKSQFNIVDFVDISSLITAPIKGHSYKDFKPQFPNTIVGSHDMFDAIDEDDIVLHHPYHSFDPVINLLEHASIDKDVVNIKQTLYRVSSIDSPIIRALCNASRNGKDVVVMLELKARFDESTNINIIETLKDAGVKVVHGPETLKTHCKAILITKRTRKGVKYYSHIGTGNYSEKNAKLYTDLSYFTANNKIGEDLVKLFNALSGFSDPTNMKYLKHSPYNLRSTITEMIDKQIEKARAGEKASCVFKVNSLSDQNIVDKIYEAGEAGVEMILIVRGICTVRATKNIKIKSIIGRFLEHSRLYYFTNDTESKLFMSSADLLTRNLDNRIELLTPLKGKTKEDVVQILLQNILDDYNSYEMNEKSEWVKVQGNDISCQDYFMKKAKSESKMRSTYVMSSKKIR